jgi:hypothetical protein
MCEAGAYDALARQICGQRTVGGGIAGSLQVVDGRSCLLPNAPNVMVKSARVRTRVRIAEPRITWHCAYGEYCIEDSYLLFLLLLLFLFFGSC